MKGQIYRLAYQTKIHQRNKSSDQLNQLLDNKLRYLNRSFEHNMKIQEIFLDIIKNKRTIHAKELKEYYRLFTSSKAESIMFQNQIQNKNENLEGFQDNKDLPYSMRRLYCRLIEKIMVKISYYLMNKPYFNFVSAHATELIKKCQTLMRRLNFLKDLNNINQAIERIFKENEEFQDYIFYQLINKGYINSVDQFYRINGIDLEHRDIYERNKDTEDEEEENEEDKQIEEAINQLRKSRFKVKYESNLSKDIINSNFKKEVMIIRHSKHKMNNNNRAGMVELEAKYKDLIISLDKIISDDQIQQISEVKQTEENEKDQIEATNTASILQEKKRQHIDYETLDKSKEIKRRITEKRNFDERRTITLKKQLSKKSSQNLGYQFQNKSQLHKQQITIPGVDSNSMISDPNRQKSRKASRKHTSPFFSKSFVDAIKSIEQINLNDRPNRLSIKRMSAHIIQFQIKSQKENTMSQKSTKQKGKQKETMMQVLKKSNQKKSIIKLLNIYKNRTLQNYIGDVRKELIETSKNFQQNSRRKETRPDKRFQLGERSQSRGSQNNSTTEQSKDDHMKKRKILRHQTKQSIFKKESTKKLKHLEHLKSQLTHSLDKISTTEDLLKNFCHLQNRIKIPVQPSIFHNFRLSQKISISRNSSKILQVVNISQRASPERQSLNSGSILTSNGIEKADFSFYKKEKEKVDKLNKTVQITPTQTPLFPHFQIYDRTRRIKIKG